MYKNVVRSTEEMSRRGCEIFKPHNITFRPVAYVGHLVLIIVDLKNERLFNARGKDSLHGDVVPAIIETVPELFCEVFKGYMFKQEELTRMDWMGSMGLSKKRHSYGCGVYVVGAMRLLEKASSMITDVCWGI